MASPPASNSKLGDLVADDREVFRAFAEKNFRRRKDQPPHQVRYFSYLLREEDIGDGLSVGLTPADAVKELARNFGYCSILVSAIRALPFGLEVRIDATDQNHAYICGLPLMTISDQQRSQAVYVAGELARLSNCVTCNPYP